MRLADEDGQHQLGADHDVVGRDVLGLFLPDKLAKLTQAAHQRLAQALLMRAPIGRRYGVAVPAIAAVRPQRPCDGPFNPALIARKVLASCKEVRGGALTRADLFAQVIGQAARKLKHGLWRHVGVGH